ncbi:MAG: NhaC family Na+:H+ antiporter [Planctomycetota bacterium]|jgi:NhaC family Na+:H+ antiporter
MSSRHADITLVQAALPVVTMIVGLVLGSQFMDVGPPLLVPVMLLAATVAAFFARRAGHNFDDLQKLCGSKLAGIMPMLLILLAIGMLIGSWMLSGTIPFMIYYGLQLVDPNYLLVTAFCVTAVMSMATGTSFGSAGTIGVALMGMAQVAHVPLGMCAGAVLSGAYLGDKMSPLSDTTNISAIGAGANLYDHIRQMMYTSLPSMVLAVVVYLIAGFGLQTEPNSTDASAAFLQELGGAFEMSILLMAPVLVVIIGVIRKTPPVLAMTMSSLVALLIGMFLHGFSLQDALTAAANGFDVQMFESRGITANGFSEDFGKLVTRGGLYSMVGNFVMIIAAFILAAGLELSGALNKMIQAMLSGAKSTLGLISATMGAGAIMIGLTSHSGVTALVIGNLFQGAYSERGFAPQNLSRSIEDSVTIVEPLMPWTVSGIFMATTLGVATVDYLPWAVFCYSGSLFSLLIAASFDRTGFGLKRKADWTSSAPTQENE